MYFLKIYLFSWLNSHLLDYPTPINLSYTWSFGSLSGILLIVQIISGLFLAVHYIDSTDLAFASVEHIMRDINYGWFFRYLHSNTASFFFMVVYLHIARGLYYKSYIKPRLLLWLSGIIIFLLMMATAFIGYVLPWGQMSFWGAVVITNLFSAIPYIGKSIAFWIWGGFSVDCPTLTRFFTLHFLIPFIILALTVIHLAALHLNSSNTSVGFFTSDKIRFHPFFTIKDTFILLVCFLFFGLIILQVPDFLGHPDNYIKANILVTPAHIVPEWYFLPFYAILRAIPDKLLGVLAMFFSIVFLGLIPYFDSKTTVTDSKYKPFYRRFLYIYFANFILLGKCGMSPATEYWIVLSQLLTIIHFLFLLLLLPWTVLVEEFCWYNEFKKKITKNEKLINTTQKKFFLFNFTYDDLCHACYDEYFIYRTHCGISSMTGVFFILFFFDFNLLLHSSPVVEKTNEFMLGLFNYSLNVGVNLIISLILLVFMVAFFTVVERKILASIQRRNGPDTNGFWGLLQAFADGLKLIFKDLLRPSKSNIFIFWVTPVVSFIMSFSSWAFLPFSEFNTFAMSSNSILWILAGSILNIYAIILAGWSSNSKYSLLGSLRAISQYIAYDIFIFLTLLPVILVSGSFDFEKIITTQLDNVFPNFIMFFPSALMFFIGILAETSRTPFDLPEAEAELVGGYNTEYAGFSFSLFFLAEYASILVMSAVWVIFFWGGTNPIFNHLYDSPLFPFNGAEIMFLKIFILTFLIVVIRAVLPRYRYDQLINIGWTGLLPAAFAFFIFVLVVLAVNDAFLKEPTYFNFVPNEFFVFTNYYNDYSFVSETLRWKTEVIDEHTLNEPSNLFLNTGINYFYSKEYTTKLTKDWFLLIHAPGYLTEDGLQLKVLLRSLTTVNVYEKFRIFEAYTALYPIDGSTKIFLDDFSKGMSINHNLHVEFLKDANPMMMKPKP